MVRSVVLSLYPGNSSTMFTLNAFRCRNKLLIGKKKTIVPEKKGEEKEKVLSLLFL